MARKSKNVYERIEEKQKEIQFAEDQLIILKNELETLYGEKDDLEMRELLNQMKSHGLEFSKAMELLSKSK